MSIKSIVNYKKVSDRDSVFTGGLPTEAQLQSIKAEGFTAVINLLSKSENENQKENKSFDEKKLVEDGLQLTYYSIPVEWQQPTMADYEAFEKVMREAEAGNGKVFVHCTTNHRATFFVKTYGYQHWDWTELQAEAFGANFWKADVTDAEHAVWANFADEVKKKIQQAKIQDSANLIQQKTGLPAGSYSVEYAAGGVTISPTAHKCYGWLDDKYNTLIFAAETKADDRAKIMLIELDRSKLHTHFINHKLGRDQCPDFVTKYTEAENRKMPKSLNAA